MLLEKEEREKGERRKNAAGERRKERKEKEEREKGVVGDGCDNALVRGPQSQLIYGLATE